MSKHKPKLALFDISSSLVDPLSWWKPENLEDIFLPIDLCIGMSDDSASNYFYVTIATPEALRKKSTEFLISENRTIIIDHFDYKLIKKIIEGILEKCNKDNWSESCAALQKYFAWEYENYH